MRIIGVIKETHEGETRVSLVPEVVASVVKNKLAEVFVEAGAGERAGARDEDYRAVGANIASREDIIKRCEWLITINGKDLLKSSSLTGKSIIGLFDPYFLKDEINQACKNGNTLVSLELIPRISRAQSMDVLSSQANIAGYMAVLIAANKLPKIFPLMMTAAGTIKPAKVLVVGAGVAGLQAIATAKRLGAVVYAYDVRPTVKEQVESLSAKFVDVSLDESGEGTGGYAKALSEDVQKKQREKLTLFAKDMDAIITTAQIPGKPAPRLLNEDIFTLMKKDSVIIDMASASGGNVSASVSNRWIEKDNVSIYGGDSLARLLPKDASFTFSKNVLALIELLFANEELDLEDDIIKDAVICHRQTFVNKLMRLS